MAKNKETSEELTTKSESAVVVAEENYEEDGAAGFEAADQNDYSLAFLGILQTLSKAVEDGTYPKGHIMNSATGKAIDGELGFFFVPSFRQRLYVEWISRDKGGGRVADYQPEHEVVLKAIEDADDPFDLYVNENHLIETYYMYGIVITDEGYYEACIPFKSSHIKKYKGWMTELRALKFEKRDGTKTQFPLFAHKFHLRTIGQEHAGGKSFNWAIDFADGNASESRLPTNDEHYLLAKALYKFLTEEGTKVNFNNESKVNQDGADSDPDLENM